jgi:hypothetical protein
MVGFANDDVVEHPDANNVGGLLQADPKLPVFWAWRRVAGGVIVGEGAQM